MRTSVRAARLLPYREYQRALIIAQAQAESKTHRQVRDSIKEKDIN